jgi:hypothetical protein
MTRTAATRPDGSATRPDGSAGRLRRVSARARS